MATSGGRRKPTGEGRTQRRPTGGPRDAIDGSVPGSALSAICIHVDAEDRFTGLSIELIAQYGMSLIPLADQTRDRAAEVLRTVLGLLVPSIVVSAMHVHFSDVTVGDPQVTDPRNQ